MNTFTNSMRSMDTVITIKVVTAARSQFVEEKVGQALSVFPMVESICSRFDPQSEVMQLIHSRETPVQVSRLLFEAISFACEVADFTNGTFDPTVGQLMEKNGFNRHYLTRQIVSTQLPNDSLVSYKDIVLDHAQQTVLLQKPLIIDLGAVAKGLAVDLAAKQLQEFEGFAIDAGGDLFVFGVNEQKEPWKIGIRHPVEPEKSICTLRLTNAAICTSGSYERKSNADPLIHHILRPQTRTSPRDLLSATVIAPYAMMADAFSTAVFIQGAPKGIETLEEAEIEGLLIAETLDLHMTKQLKRYLYE